MKKLFIYFYEQVAVLYGKVIDMDTHSHHFIQLSIGTGKGFKLTVENHTYHAKTMIINHDVAHQFEGLDDKQMIVLIDPESPIGLMLKQKYLRDESAASLQTDFDQFVFGLQNAEGPTYIQMEQRIEKLFDILIGEQFNPELLQFDQRIQKAQAMLKNTPETITYEELVKSVFLSESRLSHLFTEHIGISVKQFMLWQKLLRSLKAIMQDNSFTESAYIGGFADAAHLSRTFKRMFGVTLTDVFKNSSTVQVIFPESTYDRVKK